MNSPYATQKRHPFSQPERLDTFSLRITRKTLLTWTATFTIADDKGSLIYRHTFLASSLIGFDMDDDMKAQPARAEAVIRSRVDTFFDERLFKAPALSPEETFDPSMSEKQVWLLSKTDQTVVGFT